MTNGYSSRLGINLMDIIRAAGGSPRFVRFRTVLAGEVQKGIRRGDHEVEMILLVGVSYTNAVTRSRDTLRGLMMEPGYVTAICDDLKALGLKDEITGADITDADVQDAFTGTAPGRKGLLTGYEQTLAGANPDDANADVYEPLVVDGEEVPCCKVYKGPGDPADPKAPKPGNVYITGVIMSQRVVTESPNGSKIPSRRGAVAVVKGYLETLLSLPAARIRTPRFHQGESFEMACGETAFHAQQFQPVRQGRTPVVSA
jgi:hypothetical protein